MAFGEQIDIEGLPFGSSWEMFKAVFKARYAQYFHINEGDEVPSELELVDVDTGTRVRLKNLIPSNGIPLILNFGSCT